MREYINGNGNGKGSQPDGHLERKMMVAYITGTCLPEERDVIENHCIDCMNCRTHLATLLRLNISADEAEQRKLEPLLPIGQQAAANAREIISLREKRNRRRT